MPDIKVFTIEEANQLLPSLTDLLHLLKAKRDQVTEREVEIDALELMGGGEVEPLVSRREELIAEFYAVAEQIHEHGCFLKDVEMGLIDFYGMLEGNLVFLCWRFGEEKVGFWHDVETGYSGRRPLPKAFNS